MVRAICGVHLKYRKLSKNLILIFGLNETMYQLTMADNVYWHSYLLMMVILENGI